MTARARDRILVRLLGPERPELSCEGCSDELDRYVEPELEGGDAHAAVPRMRAHLAGCPACAAHHASLLALTGVELRDPERGPTWHL